MTYEQRGSSMSSYDGWYCDVDAREPWPGTDAGYDEGYEDPAWVESWYDETRACPECMADPCRCGASEAE